MASVSKEKEKETEGLDFSKTDSLKDVIDESLERLADEEPPPPRRKNKINGKVKKDGRGRPSKEESDARAREEEAARFAQAQQAAADLAPALKFAVAMPFDYAVEKTGYAGCALNEAEKETLSRQLDGVIKQYLPAIPSEHAALATLATSILFLSVGKFLEYRRWLIESKTKKETKAVETENVSPY